MQATHNRIPKGDVNRFFEHLRDVLGCDGKTNFLLDVLAWRYQRPSEPKPHYALYLLGEQGGAGESTFAETHAHVFGRESVKTVNATKEPTSKGSVDYWSRTCLVVEEAQVSQGTALYDNIKSFTGTDEIDTDRKYKNVSKHKIPAQLIMLSNRPPAFIEHNEGRFFVHCWQVDLDRPGPDSSTSPAIEDGLSRGLRSYYTISLLEKYVRTHTKRRQ